MIRTALIAVALCWLFLAGNSWAFEQRPGGDGCPDLVNGCAEEIFPNHESTEIYTLRTDSKLQIDGPIFRTMEECEKEGSKSGRQHFVCIPGRGVRPVTVWVMKGYVCGKPGSRGPGINVCHGTQTVGTYASESECKTEIPFMPKRTFDGLYRVPEVEGCEAMDLDPEIAPGAIKRTTEDNRKADLSIPRRGRGQRPEN
jgi:hypothetical protein